MFYCYAFHVPLATQSVWLSMPLCFLSEHEDIPYYWCGGIIQPGVKSVYSRGAFTQGAAFTQDSAYSGGRLFERALTRGFKASMPGITWAAPTHRDGDQSTVLDAQICFAFVFYVFVPARGHIPLLITNRLTTVREPANFVEKFNVDRLL